MTKEQKRFAVIGGFVLLLILLLWLFGRGKGGQVIEATSPFNLPAMGDIGPIYIDNGSPFVIPGLDLGGPDLSMIGACCSDCMQAQPTAYNYGPGNTYVFNEGNAGPNVYNYFGGGSSQSVDCGPWATFINGRCQSYIAS